MSNNDPHFNACKSELLAFGRIWDSSDSQEPDRLVLYRISVLEVPLFEITSEFIYSITLLTRLGVRQIGGILVKSNSQ